jgi:hypothetical protein
MPRVVYVHRISKVLDEIVRDLGLTMTITDQNSDVDLAKSLDNVKVATEAIGLKIQIEPLPNGKSRITFSR